MVKAVGVGVRSAVVVRDIVGVRVRVRDSVRIKRKGGG
jgi:hypothetical protein